VAKSAATALMHAMASTFEAKPLTERDIDTLGALRAASDDAIKHDPREMRSQGWVMPMDCGGFNGSHHSYTLSKLARHGYAERYKFGGKREKGSCRYRINDAGRKFLADHKRKAA
jgi:hypothetical protein